MLSLPVMSWLPVYTNHNEANRATSDRASRGMRGGDPVLQSTRSCCRLSRAICTKDDGSEFRCGSLQLLRCLDLSISSSWIKLRLRQNDLVIVRKDPNKTHTSEKCNLLQDVRVFNFPQGCGADCKASSTKLGTG